MKRKLKVFLVDENIYWCDYSFKEAEEGYKNFCLKEQGFYSRNLLYYHPVELSEDALDSNEMNEDLNSSGATKTFRQHLKTISKPCLFYCG